MEYITKISARMGEKPEGTAVELADAVIRILDYFEKEHLEYNHIADTALLRNSGDDFGDFIARCHSDVSDAYFREFDSEDFIDRTAALSVCIRRIESWCESRGLDLAEIIAIKHEYNKSRPYRHGGKKI